MKLRALALSVLFAAGCHSPKVVTEVPPFLTVKASKPTKKKRQVVHTPKPLSDVWHRIADCESGKRDQNNEPIAGTADWDIENPPYTGGVQFMLSTWRLAGGTKYAPTAGQATPAQQIAIAKSWLAKTDWASQWPRCSRLVGAR